MFIIDKSRFEKALQEKGFKSIGELAHSLGIHRNTIHHYLSGASPFPSNFEKMMEALDLTPSEIVRKKEDPLFLPLKTIAPIIDQLHTEFPKVTFVLFGSRVQERSQKYSDWDVGVFARLGLPHSEYRQIVRRTDDLVEDLPILLDIINLNRADSLFLREASKNWMFLAGLQQDWIELQKRSFE